MTQDRKLVISSFTMRNFIKNSVNKLHIWILNWQLEVKFRIWFGTQFFIFRPYFIWERKIFKSNGFFLQKEWRSTFTEFNWHKFSSMRYVFVKIFGLKTILLLKWFAAENIPLVRGRLVCNSFFTDFSKEIWRWGKTEKNQTFLKLIRKKIVNFLWPFYTWINPDLDFVPPFGKWKRAKITLLWADTTKLYCCNLKSKILLLFFSNKKLNLGFCESKKK